METHDIITLDGVGVTFGERPVLRDVSLAVGRGDFVVITGPNGGGKTTLLRVMLGLLKPSAGRVARRSDTLTGYLPQAGTIDRDFPITVGEMVAAGLMRRGKREDRLVARRRLQEALRLVGLEDLRRSGIGELSGGQLQRALLARAIIGRPDLLVLDEPLSYLDKDFERRFYDIIGQLAATTTVVIVSHELSGIARMANRHLLVDGTLRECAAHSHGVITECH